MSLAQAPRDHDLERRLRRRRALQRVEDSQESMRSATPLSPKVPLAVAHGRNSCELPTPRTFDCRFERFIVEHPRQIDDRARWVRTSQSIPLHDVGRFEIIASVPRGPLRARGGCNPP
jgi:hypothetical protein